jgi:hypothetical protein
MVSSLLLAVGLRGDLGDQRLEVGLVQATHFVSANTLGDEDGAKAMRALAGADRPTVFTCAKNLRRERGDLSGLGDSFEVGGEVEHQTFRSNRGRPSNASSSR